MDVVNLSLSLSGLCGGTFDHVLASPIVHLSLQHESRRIHYDIHIFRLRKHMALLCRAFMVKLAQSSKDNLLLA